MTELFVGVVSHDKSRFAASQGPAGLARRLAEAGPNLGFEATVRVNTANLHDPAVVPVTEAMVQASLTEQLRLDRRWAEYLAGSRGPKWWATHGLRWVRRSEQSLRSPGTSMVERLLNIERSHLDLLAAGLAAEAGWVLILEDDAVSTDVTDCARGIAGIMATGADEQPAFVNLSQSFTTAELGIDHLLSPVASARWAGAAPRTLLSASRPVTNTVCAILYRASFVRLLVSAMAALPMEPVVPIDWKLNVALMNLFNEGILGPGDCWLVDPGPIDQLSMQSGQGA